MDGGGRAGVAASGDAAGNWVFAGCCAGIVYGWA